MNIFFVTDCTHEVIYASPLLRSLDDGQLDWGCYYCSELLAWRLKAIRRGQATTKLRVMCVCTLLVHLSWMVQKELKHLVRVLFALVSSSSSRTLLRGWVWETENEYRRRCNFIANAKMLYFRIAKSNGPNNRFANIKQMHACHWMEFLLCLILLLYAFHGDTHRIHDGKVFLSNCLFYGCHRMNDLRRVTRHFVLHHLSCGNGTVDRLVDDGLTACAQRSKLYK